MRVVITGATGFIGRALVQTLIGRGDHVIAWTRDKERAAGLLGPTVQLASGDEIDAAVDGADAVVNLAGEPIIGRWTDSKKERLVRSRIDLTERVVTAIGRANRPPEVLVSASAIGIFQSGFGAELCEHWETAARSAEHHGCRVAIVRIGLVLGAEGGMLGSMVPIFRLGLGGQLGDGSQWTSWIHIDDLVATLLYATDTQISGAFTATAPAPVTNAEFTRALGTAMDKPTLFTVPAFAIKLALGEAAQMLLESPRALPETLMSEGFEFKFPTVDAALADVMHRDTPEISDANDTPSELPSRPRSVLRSRVVLDAPVDEVFPFFSAAANLGLMTPHWMGFRIISGSGESVKPGDLIDYRIKLGPIPMRWRTEITVWDEGQRFVDNQLKGPYALWWHEHRFEADGDQTVMHDTVYFRVPLGPIGRLAEWLFVRGMLERVFRYRGTVIRRLFSERTPAKHEDERNSAAA